MRKDLRGQHLTMSHVYKLACLRIVDSDVLLCKLQLQQLTRILTLQHTHLQCKGLEAALAARGRIRQHAPLQLSVVHCQ
jgi:hypothetical protein